jgi:hypothetical protein
MQWACPLPPSGVGANADLPFTVDVGDGVVVGDGTAAGRRATVVDARPPGCWVAATPTTTGWFGPLVDELVGTGWGPRAKTVAAGGWSGNGRKGEWIVGPPSRVLNSRQTYPTAGTTTIATATRSLRSRQPDPSTKTGLFSVGGRLLPVMTRQGYASRCGRPQLSGYASALAHEWQMVVRVARWPLAYTVPPSRTLAQSECRSQP